MNLAEEKVKEINLIYKFENWDTLLMHEKAHMCLDITLIWWGGGLAISLFL